MLCRPSQSPPLFSSWHNPRMNGIHYERRKGECGISSITRRLLALLTAAAVLWAAGGCRQGENPADVSLETSLSGESRPEDSSTGDASPGGEASGGSVPDDSAAGAARLKAGFRTVPLLEGRLRETRPQGSPRQTIRRRVLLHRITPPRKSHWKSSTTVLGPAARSCGPGQGSNTKPCGASACRAPGGLPVSVTAPRWTRSWPCSLPIAVSR